MTSTNADANKIKNQKKKDTESPTAGEHHKTRRNRRGALFNFSFGETTARSVVPFLYFFFAFLHIMTTFVILHQRPVPAYRSSFFFALFFIVQSKGCLTQPARDRCPGFYLAWQNINLIDDIDREICSCFTLALQQIANQETEIKCEKKKKS